MRREARFLELLRTYPERRPEESLALVGALVESGDFAERDRAEYWLGSARLSVGDRDGARESFARLARDYPGSAWVERSQLGLGDAAAQERRYSTALAFYARAATARDAAVRELSRISSAQARTLLARQRWARGACAFAALVALGMIALVARARTRLLPLPAELRIAGPVLFVLCVLALRQDPAPRAAVLELAFAGVLFVTLSALVMRSFRGAGARALSALLAVSAFLSLGYAVVYRNDLAGMVQETFRAGPE